MLPDYVSARTVAEGRLCRLPVDDLQVGLWLQLLHHRDKWLSPAMQTVIEYCLDTMQLI